MSATTKFYGAVFLALAIVVAVSFALGYRAGYGHATATTHRPSARAVPRP